MDKKGFTLLEVMIAVAIIAIALTALLGSQAQSLSLANEAKFNTTAALLAQGRMARIEFEGEESMVGDSGDFGEDFPGYRWETRVSDVDSGEIEGLSDYLKHVDLEVAWGESGRYRYSLQFLYFMFEPEE